MPLSNLSGLQEVAPKLDEEQADYVLLLKQLLKASLKHIQQLQQLPEAGYEGPYFPDSLPLSALEQLFAMTWQSCEAAPELSMKRVVKEVAAEAGVSAAALHVRSMSCLCAFFVVFGCFGFHICCFGARDSAHVWRG